MRSRTALNRQGCEPDRQPVLCGDSAGGCPVMRAPLRRNQPPSRPVATFLAYCVFRANPWSVARLRFVQRTVAGIDMLCRTFDSQRIAAAGVGHLGGSVYVVR
jgi:hypothetical protein